MITDPINHNYASKIIFPSYAKSCSARPMSCIYVDPWSTSFMDRVFHSWRSSYVTHTKSIVNWNSRTWVSHYKFLIGWLNSCTKKRGFRGTIKIGDLKTTKLKTGSINHTQLFRASPICWLIFGVVVMTRRKVTGTAIWSVYLLREVFFPVNDGFSKIHYYFLIGGLNRST